MTIFSSETLRLKIFCILIHYILIHYKIFHLVKIKIIYNMKYLLQWDPR